MCENANLHKNKSDVALLVCCIAAVWRWEAGKKKGTSALANPRTPRMTKQKEGPEFGWVVPYVGGCGLLVMRNVYFICLFPQVENEAPFFPPFRS